MAEQKTKPTKQSVQDFIAAVADDQMRDDCAVLIKMMKKITGANAVLWGPSIIGFGEYHYTYASGHSGTAPLAGFSPRKPNLTVYAMPVEGGQPLLEKLGKHKASKACIYIKKLADVDLAVLQKIITQSVKETQKKFPQKKK
jgi:hypothetical protein